MRIWTRVEFDIATSQLIGGEWDEYTGAIVECKGASTADAQRQQELQMQSQAFQTQMQQLQQLQSQLSPYTTAQGQGYTPQQMATMQSQFLNNNAAQFQNAGQAVRAALLARGSGGGDLPVGGDYTRGISSLMGAAASSQAQGLLGLQAQNAQQALANKFNALGLETGGAQILGQTQGVAGSGASNALNAYVQASNSGFLSNLARGLGAGLGGLATMGVGGGIGSLMSGLGGGGSSGGFQGGVIDPGGSFGSAVAPSLSSVGAMPTSGVIPSSIYG